MGATKQPADQSHFILPDLGEGVHEAELIKWRVNPGDTVEEHQTLAEMETDKALVEVPSPWPGVVKQLNGNEGDIINVGSILVEYTIQSSADTEPEIVSEVMDSAPDEDEDAGTVVGTVAGELEVSNRFARRSEEHIDMEEASGKAMATPAVRRIARDLGIDINRVPGSGRGGRVTATDVVDFNSGSPSEVQPTPVEHEPSAADFKAAEAEVASANDLMRAPMDLPSVSGDGVRERIPFRGIRRKIAQALDLSVKTAVHFTVVEEVDVTALNVKRNEYARVLGRKISLLPFLMDAVCKGLRQHPSLNANVDDANEMILIKDVINLGCAVDTEHGLMVPNIERADSRSIVELADHVALIAEGCKNRTIERERLTGGTFTISNVGSYGGRFATPIINYPEVAILAAGRAFEKVMASEGRIFAGTALPLSLSCDHRVVDGAESARFLNTVKSLLETPAELLG
jgi:pyruvate dehydrogenase E2 component (dihydrolipoamide acetyltransferase)